MKLNVCLLLLFATSSLQAQSRLHSTPASTMSSQAWTSSRPDDPFTIFDVRLTKQTGFAVPAGSISVQQLAIPPKALAEFRRSQKSFQAGDLRSACSHLQKALRLYPSFVEAHNNLADAYIGLQQYEKAVVELRLAIAINPNVDVPYSNLSNALFSLGRYSESEEAARHGIELNPQRNTLLYNLGRSLAAQRHYTAEAEEALRQASKEIPGARLTLALVLSGRGSADQAASELREYLKAPDPALKAAVQDWLSELEQRH